MTELPTVLQNAIDLHRREVSIRSRPPIELSSARIGRGDLRFVRSCDGGSTEARLVLVLSIDSHRDFAEVMLVHTSAELACDIDVVVPAGDSLTPYEVVVETDLRGVVWSWQLAKAVGRLESQVLDDVLSDATEQPSDEPRPSLLKSAPRLAGPVDPRWAFKRAEGESFRRLTVDCTEALLDDGVPWMVDPGLLRPELLDIADDPQALVLDLLHWVQTRSMSISAEDIDHLLELGALDVDAWSVLGDLGTDVWTALQELIERAAMNVGSGPAMMSAGWRLLTATHLETVDWSVEPVLVYHLGQREEVAA